MRTFRITFSTGIFFDFIAERVEDGGPTVSLFDDQDQLVIKYTDSEILSVDPVPGAPDPHP